MKTEQLIFNTIISLSLIFFFVACEEEDKTFTGNPIFAFESASESVVINQVDPIYEIPVMLVGPHQSEQKTVNFEVLPFHVNISGDTIRTTAESGLHYKSFIQNNVVFTANTSMAHIPVELLFENLERGVTYTLVLELKDSDFATSEKANNVTIFRFIPHLHFIPETMVGTFNAREISNFPNRVRNYPVTLEHDSTHINGRIFYFSVDGLWLRPVEDSTPNAWDRRKINLVINDTNHLESSINAPSPQNFFRIANEEFVNWNIRQSGTFNTWENTFSFPSFDLLRDDTGANFPPNVGANPESLSGQNVRVQLLLD